MSDIGHQYTLMLCWAIFMPSSKFWGAFFMDAKDISFIQDQIGYNFKNTDLLQQAFVRRSYSHENGGENNEVLEFIGDKVLDFIVVKLLSDKFGYTKGELDDFDSENDWDEYACDYCENKLTEIKKQLVQKQNLATCIDELGLAEYLIMGKSDQKQHADEQPSVKEDLFEAILGAVAIDSGWNLEKLQDTVELMLKPETTLEEDDEDNYVALIQEWCSKETGNIPLYHFEEGSYQATWYMPFDGISQNCNVLGSPEYNKLMASTHRCLLKIADDIPIFRGFGKSKSEARKNVCRLAYEWLDKNDRLHTIRNELENPNRNEAIGQLEILARRGYFTLPTYEFEQEHDENGNPVWTAKCYVEEAEFYFDATSSSKKEAKKDAAFEMLKYVLEEF